MFGSNKIVDVFTLFVQLNPSFPKLNINMMNQTEAVEWKSRLKSLFSEVLSQDIKSQNKLAEVWLNVSNVLERLSNKNFLGELNAILESEPPMSAGCFNYESDEKEISFWPRLISALNRLRIDSAQNAKEELRSSLEVSATEQHRKWVLKAMFLAKFWSDAMRLAEEILARDPKCYSTKITLARTTRIMGDFEQSIRHWQELISAIPDEFEFYGELGNTQFSAKRFDDAIASYHFVLRHNPDDIAAHLSIYAAYRELNLADNAEAALQKAISIPGISDETYEQIVKGFLTNEPPEKTLQIIERWLESSPGNPAATHHRNSCLAALKKSSVAAAASSEYIEKQFDGFASSFERQLKLLEYHGPQVIAEALSEHFGDSDCKFALDAGCGTGWCGPAIRKFTKCLIGIDLSASMLDIAKQKSVYDKLVKTDLVKYLNEQTQRFDLIVSLDTLVYFGDLALVFKAVKAAMGHRGVFVFSIELLESDEMLPYSLQLNGRYSHSVSYVQEVLATAGLEATIIERRVLRMEKAQPVYHLLVNVKHADNLLSLAGLVGETDSELSKEGTVANAATKIVNAGNIVPSRKGCEFRDKSLKDKVLIYKGFLGRQPDLGPAHFELGNAYLGLGEFEKAIQSFQDATNINPDAAGYTNLGNAYAQSGNLAAAVESFQKALEFDSCFIPAINNVGRAESELGNTSDAIKWLERAIELDPNNAKSHAFIANIYVADGNYEAAINAYTKSLESDAKQPDILVLLGHAYQKLFRYGDAAASYVKAQQLNPQNPLIYDLIGQVNWHRGQITEAGFCHLQALQLSSGNSDVHSNLLHNLLYDSTVEISGLQSESKIWQAKHPLASRTSFEFMFKERDPNRRLKVGYFSSAFAEKTFAGSILNDVLENHSSDRFESFCYGWNVSEKLVSGSIASSCDHWREIDAGLSDDAIAKWIREDNVDILIDLDGHRPGNRISVFMHRAAPIQVSWMGYAGTTGLKEMDFIISDEFAIPKGEMKFYCESPLLLPNGSFFGRLSKNDSEPESISNALPQTVNGFVTFGCLNPVACVSPNVIQVWSQILSSVSNSQLLIANQSCLDSTVRARLSRSFAEFGIDDSRLNFFGIHPDEDAQSAIEKIDVYLDTFPYAGAGQIWDVLFAGVPVVAKSGAGIRGRSSHSILSSLGLSYLSVMGNDGYVELAVELANNVERLRSLKIQLPEKAAGSPNCDPRKFTLKLEDALQDAWQSYCKKS